MNAKMTSVPRAFDVLPSTPWAILPGKLAEIERTLSRGFLELDYAAERFRWQASAQAVAARAARAHGTAVAVIPIFGMISQRADIFTDFFGGTPVDRLTKSFRAAVADPSVRAIVLDVDSPGGNVAGVPELAAEILAARGRGKEIIAVADSMAASAAYWLASAADNFVASPSSEVGSIGVYAMHMDFSKALEMDGMAPSIISSARYKAEGNPYQPLSPEARAFLQKRVDEYGEMFVRAVGQGRGVSMKTVRESFGQGRMFGAAKAKGLGMVDRVATLDAVLANFGVGGPASSAAASVRQTAGAFADARARLRDIEFQRTELGAVPSSGVAPPRDAAGEATSLGNDPVARLRDIEMQREQRV